MVLVWDLWPDPRLGFVHKCLQNDCYSVSKHFGLRPTDAVKSLVSEKQNIHKHLQYKYHKYLLKKGKKVWLTVKMSGEILIGFFFTSLLMLTNPVPGL